MSKQIEALRLADMLEMGSIWQDQEAAAAELRRLYEENQELLEALKFVLSATGEQLTTAFEQAEFAIDKTTRENV